MSKLRKPRPIVCRWPGPLWSPDRLRIAIDPSPVAAEVLAIPRRHLQAYQDIRDDSPLGKSFAFAAEIFSRVDAVVVIGCRETLEPIRVLAEACLDPFHNHTDRAERGSKPRIYFVDERRDNDLAASILQRLQSHDPAATLPERSWGLIVLGPADRFPAADLFQHAFENQATPPRGCRLEWSPIEPSPLGNATLFVAAALGLDTIQLLVGSMAVSDAIIAGQATTTAERLVACLADRPVVRVHESALDRWCRWYESLGPTSGDTITISPMRTRMDIVLERGDDPPKNELPANELPTIELPVIDTLSLGTLIQAAALGHAVARSKTLI